MTDAFEEYMQSLSDASDKLREIRENAQQKLVKKLEKLHIKENEQAEQRRDGEWGSDWKILQKRIDNEETEYADIISGNDKSEEGQRVWKTYQQNSEILQKKLEEYYEDNEEEAQKLHDAKTQIEQEETKWTIK